jgi:ariadne-1
MAAKERLQEDVESLVRVRNRLAKAADAQLPKILSALLPKLLTKLEESLTTVQQRGILDDEEHQRLCWLAQEHMSGILHHGLERIRGNPDLETHAILAAVTPSLNSTCTVRGTWALIYVQGGISRCSARDTLPPAITPTLIQSMDHWHGTLMESVTQDDASTTRTTPPIAARLTSSSWLLLDCIMMNAGLKPLIDWDMDCFDETDVRWEIQKSDSLGRLASDADVEAVSRNGTGVFHLLIDLLLFWPNEIGTYLGISAAGESRICHRSRISKDDMEFALRQQRQQQRQHRRLARVGGVVVNNKWSPMAEMYLRHLKLVALRYAVWPMGQGLFQGDNLDKALVLAILVSGKTSMHGRLATDFLNKFSSGQDYRTTTSSGVKEFHKPQPKYYSIHVALALLVLMVGDERSAPLLVAYVSEHGEAPWKVVLGEIPMVASLRRPALPSMVSERVVDFMLRHRVALEGTKSENDAMRLLMNLTLLLATIPEGDKNQQLMEARKNGKIFGVQLMETFLDHLSLPRGDEVSSPAGDESWMISVIKTGLGVAIEVISLLLEAGEAHVERPRVGNREVLPQGVPAPFPQRNDLNRMLNEHRTSQKRRRLASDKAVRARQVAYSLIERYAAHSISREERPFELPAYLLRCGIHEDASLQQYVSEASKAILDLYCGYVEVMEWQKLCPTLVIDGSQGSLQQAVVPLLPAMLEAACSDSQCSRLLVIDWARRFVHAMDPEASTYLLSFLSKDNNTQVASSAIEAVSHIGQVPTTKRNPGIPTAFEYFDQSSAWGQQELNLLLQDTVNQVSHLLGDSRERAQILLFDFKFSIKTLLQAVELEEVKTLNSSGLDISLLDTENHNDGCCGICYDEILVDDGLALDCGHLFCRECWVQYIETVGNQGKYGILKIRCPQQGCICRALPTHLEVMDNAVKAKWDETLAKAFVDHACQECPGQNCQFVATTNSSDDASLLTSCCCSSCSQLFCFGCGEKPHLPATCEAMAEWSSIHQTSDFYVRKNAKPCPGCHAPIEKTQGCNHMTCTCGVQFCWLCTTQLGQHSESHTCNKYNPIKDAVDNHERRALFVAERYEAHLMAEEFAASQYESTMKRPEKLIESFAFLTEEDEITLCGALLTLCNARKYLRNSYIASFGFEGNQPGLDVLENYQGGLEMLTERLSQLTETNLQRLHMESGEWGIKNHFHGLGFFAASVSNYMDRFNVALRESMKVH